MPVVSVSTVLLSVRRSENNICDVRESRVFVVSALMFHADMGEDVCGYDAQFADAERAVRAVVSGGEDPLFTACRIQLGRCDIDGNVA